MDPHTQEQFRSRSRIDWHRTGYHHLLVAADLRLEDNALFRALEEEGDVTALHLRHRTSWTSLEDREDRRRLHPSCLAGESSEGLGEASWWSMADRGGMEATAGCFP